MGREWKPGDVALCIWASGRPTYALLHNSEEWWDFEGSIAPAFVREIRPLVVIDPEDAEQVERLTSLLYHSGAFPGARAMPMAAAATVIANALREFADPTPPKEPEPLGLGAVVEDAEGKRWVKVDMAMACDSWTEADAATAGADTWVKYDRLDVVRVLSHGVTEGES